MITPSPSPQPPGTPSSAVPPILPSLSRAGAIMLLFLAAALGLRIVTFGNPNLDADEQFYFLIGQRMHDGLFPYVDMWDRKPLGLFVIYYLIAGISRAVVAYQIAAWLFAAATAYTIYAITAEILGEMANRRGAVLAGLAYLLELGPFDGMGGQAPVFYNLFIALAALLVLRARRDLAHGVAPRGVWGAMALAGLAISVKQTAMFEAGFLGLWVLWCLYRGGMRTAALAAYAVGFALIGVLPFALTALPYLITHHWHEYWQAMVVSNFVKSQKILVRQLIISPLPCIARLVPVGMLAFAALWRRLTMDSTLFLAGWLAAALIGYTVPMIFLVHYTIPLLVPLCIAASFIFARPHGGMLAFAATACASLIWYNPADRAWHLHAIASTEALAAAVEQHDHGRGVFVFDGPSSIYALTGRRLLSPLIFPNHLQSDFERNTSYIDTNAEINRIIERAPGAVLYPSYVPNNRWINAYAWARVGDYVHSNCRRVALVNSYEHQIITPIAVYGDCGLVSPLHPIPKPRSMP